MNRIISRKFSLSCINPSFPVLFPGQGSQFVGMSTELCAKYPAAKQMFTRASEILNIDLLDICSSGPKALLDSTKYSQPAIYVSSMAAMEVYSNHMPNHAICMMPPTVALGLSLGEYSALCYSGMLSFEDGVKLTKMRGEEMQKACDLADGSMVTVMGVELKVLAELCDSASKFSNKMVHIGNYLGPMQYVLSGDTSAVEEVVSLCHTMRHDVKTTKLAVSGAFHSPLMQPAQNALEIAIRNTTFCKPRIPIIMNVNGEVIWDEKEDTDIIETIRINLINQLTRPVEWEKSLRTLLSGGMPNSDRNEVFTIDKRFNCAYEVGPGNSCSVTLKRVHRRAKVVSYDCN